jgi:hypothetical protein
MVVVVVGAGSVVLVVDAGGIVWAPAGSSGLKKIGAIATPTRRMASESRRRRSAAVMKPLEKQLSAN